MTQKKHHARARSRARRAIGVAAVAATVVAGSLGAATANADSPPPDPTDVPAAAPFAVSKQAPAVPSGKLGGPLKSATGKQTVFVELSGVGAADASTSARARGKDKTAQKAAATAAKTATRARASAVVAATKNKDKAAREVYQLSNAVPAVVLTADAAAIRDIATRSDVVSIRPVVPKKLSNAGAAQLTKVLDTWRSTGNLGKGVRVGVIDTGIDFTHADFGGVGTPAAYQAAHEVSTSPAWRDSLARLAKAKVAGGYDFAGDDYNSDPAAADYQPVPHPDANPLDCEGHGTHVSGTVAGYGVNSAGKPFRGNYSKLTGKGLYAMDIGPGMAPEATLYGLKVFGCTGSTDVVAKALDWSLDPNGDGDLSDHLDIVNLSLGSDYGVVDDPENLVINALARNGVLPVIAMGNGGDLTDIGGSPGNAVRSLAVASTVDPYQLLSGVKVNAPADIAGTAAGQTSVAYDWANAPDVTGDVVALSTANADGCDPLSAADAATVKGKVAWLTWDSDDASRRCGSAGRSANVKTAGAIGALFTGDIPIFAGGISGDADIPVFQLTLASTQKLAPAAQAGTLNVTFTKDLLNVVKDVNPAIADLASSFTSRGTHGSIGVVKPDVAAPGDTIASAGKGTGNRVEVESGTSMATPHTAGIAALVKAAHPTWSSEQVKATIMNTAGHDVWTKENQSGLKYGPARVGAGRVDALAAVNNQVLAYADAGSGGVSASFGVVEAPITRGLVTSRRTITLQNTGRQVANLSVSYSPVVKQPGVSYVVSPPQVRLRPGKTSKVVVTMVVNPIALRHTIDPTMEVDQLGVARQFVSDASGRVLIRGAGKQALRVPVFGAAKPVSQTKAKADKRGLTLTGTGIQQGKGSTAYTSLVSVLSLGATSPRLPECAGTRLTNCTVNTSAKGGDIQYVGTGSTKDWLWFGVSTWGNNATIGNSIIPFVDFDVDGDGTADFEAHLQNLSGTDVLVSTLVDLKSGTAVDAQPINFAFGDVDTNVFDTDVMLIPVSRDMLGLKATAKTLPITYTVGTFSYLTANPSGNIDTVGPVRFDLAKPAVGVASPLYRDAGQTQIPVTRGAASNDSKGNYGSPRAKALVLHLHGASGKRAEVVTLK